MQRFLSFLVEETLAGRSSQLKEYTVAVAVFGKPPEFEPGTSPIVRVEAGRLRKLLMEYAVEHDHGDPVVLQIPKGSYIPVFRARPSQTAVVEAQPRPLPPLQSPSWSLSAEWRHVTVLSCALGDEGGIAQEPAGQELLDSFDAFHESSMAVARRYGGTVDGAASDRVIVYFGWPNALEDAAGRALTAALDILTEVQVALGASSFGVRVGVATGEVVIREPSRDDGQTRPAVVGEAPALATKILQRAPLNGVLVSEATRRLTRTAFELIPAGQIEDSSDSPDLLWRLLKPRAVLSRYRAASKRLWL